MPIEPVGQFHRTNQLQNMADTLRAANVSESIINQVIETEEQFCMVRGYVYWVSTGLTNTMVQLRGQIVFGTAGGPDEWVLNFPPNRPQFLPELIRAQNHPHMRVDISGIRKPPGALHATAVDVYLDYSLAPIKFQPPFEAATSK
jgi:hypothetical protein